MGPRGGPRSAPAAQRARARALDRAEAALALDHVEPATLGIDSVASELRLATARARALDGQAFDEQGLPCRCRDRVAHRATAPTPLCCSRKTYFKTLPEALRGSSSARRKCLGTL